MKKIIYNLDNLEDGEIEEVVTRVKVLLLNDKNELLLGYSDMIYQFIGGHVEKGETFTDCIKREVLEETGIEINVDDIKPFMTIKHYTKNYNNSGKNRVSEIYYFYIKCNKACDVSKTCYTDCEKRGNFCLKYVNLDSMEKTLIENIPNNEKNKVIANEMLEALKEFKKVYTVN